MGYFGKTAISTCLILALTSSFYAEAHSTCHQSLEQSALHIVRTGERFPENAPLHAIIFDFYGYESTDYIVAEKKIKALTGPARSAEDISMGAEAYAPQDHMQSPRQVADWMKDILLEVHSQRPDNRPLVVYVRGALSEGAALLSKEHPELVAALVVENPRNSNNLDEVSEWNTESFGVPTFIVSGTKDSTLKSASKQQLYDLAKASQLNMKGNSTATPVLYLDMPFGDVDVFSSTPNNIAHTEIHRFFRKHINTLNPAVETVSPEKFIGLAQNAGIGSRRYLGYNPAPTPENGINAIQSGVLMWEVGAVVVPNDPVKSVEVAIAHYRKLKSVVEKHSNHIINSPLFIASDFPQLESLNRSPDLESALSHFPGDPAQQSANAIKLIDEAIQKKNKCFWIDEHENVHEFDPTLIQGVPTEAVYAGDNKNGFMFNLSGWTLPTIRGVLNLERAQRTSAYKNGHSYFNGSYDRRHNIISKGLVHEGYTFAKNKNLAAVLEKLRTMQRKGQSENATRFLDPYNIILMQRLFEAGHLDTIELYNEKTELVAGGLIVKIDNVWSPETIFYPPPPTSISTNPNAPLSQKLDGIDFGKAVISHMINEGVRLGHTEFDSQIASSLTIMFGATYVKTDEQFLPALKDTNAGWAERQRMLLESHAQRQAIIDQNYIEAAPQLDDIKNRIQAARIEFEALDKVATALAKEAERGVKPSAEQKADRAYMEMLGRERETRKAARAEAVKAEEKLRELEEDLRDLEYELNTRGSEDKLEVDPVLLEDARKEFEVAQEKARRAEEIASKSASEAEALEAEARRLLEIAKSSSAAEADTAAADTAIKKAEAARKKATNIAGALKQARDILARATETLRVAENQQ